MHRNRADRMAGTSARNSAAAETTLACLLCLFLTIVSVQSAPATYPEERFIETTELAQYGNVGGSGAGAGPGGGLIEPSDCYYNFQRYAEGDRIVTNEPCLNCTCHSRMLMCYLRVCPFSKAIGQDCKVEKRSDQCCPVITCPEVPVHLLTSTSTTEKVPSDTAVAFPDTYGCSIDGRFFPDGVQVPSNPEKPCELCYCIRNRTACVMQECTLQVEGCKPVLQPGVCCPVRYDCDYGDEPSATERPPPSGLILSTPTTPGPAGCTAGGYLYRDGDRVRGRTPCEHCYCMRGDVVCAVQECGPALQGCRALPPKPGRCCADAFQCANGTVSLEILSQDQNAPEPSPQPIPSGSVEDKHKQVASTAGLSAEETQTESLKDPVTSEEKFITTENYEPTIVPSPSEMGTPVKGVKGEVGFDEPTTTKYKPIEPTSQPADELPEGTTTLNEVPEVDPVKDPALPEGSHSDDYMPTTASPLVDKQTVPSGELHDVSHDDKETDADQNNQASNIVTTEPSLPESPTGLPEAQSADDTIEDAPVTSEPLIETDNDKTTATFVTTSDEYATTPTPQEKQTCEKQGQIFKLSDPVPANLVTSNPCVVNCTCQSQNAITCSVINCPPSPPHHKNCVPIRHEGVCCPTYACDGVEAPEPESDNQMAVVHDGSNKVVEATTSAPKAEDLTMATAEFSRRTTSGEVSNFVPLKDVTTAMPENFYQPTTIQPETESEKKPSALADEIDKPVNSQAASEHDPLETEHHSFDQSSHSHDEGETHEDTDSHPDLEPDIPVQTAVPEGAEHDAMPVTEEPKEPALVEDHEVAQTEASPSHQDGNEIEKPTLKPSNGLVTISEETKHETSQPAEILTTQHYEPEDVGNVITTSSVPTDASESETGPDKLNEPSDAGDHMTSDSHDLTLSPANSESQVTTNKPSEDIATTLAESDVKGSQADHVDTADETPLQTTGAAPVKEDETVTEQDEYQTTEKPEAVVQPEHDNLPSSSETSVSSPGYESPEVNVNPPSPTQADEGEPATDSVQSAGDATDKPVKIEPTDALSNDPTEKPGDIAVMEPATSAPAQVIDDLPATEEAIETDAPSKIDHPTDPPKSSEIQGSDLTTALPEVTDVPSAALSDEKPEDILGSPTESSATAEPSAGTDRPPIVDLAPSKPEESTTGTSAPSEEATKKPVAPLLEDQAEQDSGDSSSSTESIPVTPGEPEAPSHDSDEVDIPEKEESSGTEGPPKDIEKQPEQPSATVLPFEEATPEKGSVLLQDGYDNVESVTVALFAPGSSTEEGKPHSSESSPTQSPMASDGGEELDQEAGATDKQITHFDQSTEVVEKMTTVQPESPTEIPTSNHTEAVDTDDEPSDHQLTTEIPLKSVSPDSNGVATTDTSVSSSSISVADQSTRLPEGTSQPVTEPSEEEQQVTTAGFPPIKQDHIDGDPDKISDDHSEGKPEVSSGHVDDLDDAPQDHTQSTPLVTLPDLADKIQGELAHHMEETLGLPGPTVETPEDVLHPTEETPVELPVDHTDKSPVGTEQDPTDDSAAESSHDPTVGSPDDIPHDDHTDETPVENPHDTTKGTPEEVPNANTNEGDHTDESEKIPHDQTKGTTIETSHDSTDAITTEIPQDHTEGTPAEIPPVHTGDSPAEASEDHNEGTPVESDDHTEGVAFSHQQTDRSPAEDHTGGTPVEIPQDHADETFAVVHDHTEGTPSEGPQDHTAEAVAENTTGHTDGIPAQTAVENAGGQGNEGTTEGSYSPQTAYPTQAITEAPAQLQTEPSLPQTVATLHPDSPVHDKTPEDIDSNNAVDSGKPAPTLGEALMHMTTESIGASETSAPVLEETVQPLHDRPTSVPVTDQPAGTPKQPENHPDAAETHTTEVSIATVVPEHAAHIPVENLEGLHPVVSEPEETATQSNAQDNFDTEAPSSLPGISSDVPQESAHDPDNAAVGTDTESEVHTTSLPEGSQGLKAETSTESAPAEPEHLPVTVSEQVVSQNVGSSTDEGVKESSTSAAEAELTTTPPPSQEKEPSSPQHIPPSDLMDTEEVTTQSLADRITVSPQTQELTSSPEEHTEKQTVTEPVTHAKPEQTTYPAHKDRPTTTPHKELTTPPTEHKYTTTPYPVTEASSKPPSFHPPGDDFEDQDHFHEHEYTHHKDNVPTVPPSIFGGGHIDEEHPAYGSHLPTTPSHNHFGHPDEPFPVDSYTDDDDPGYGPGTCRYAGKVYVSAQQIPRDDPCDFCFCFRSDIICLQQSCPPPIPGCHEEPISGFCCPRYECPVSMATSLNLTTTSTTTTTTLPPHFLPHAYHGAATRTGCQVRGVAYRVGETVRSASGPCLHCRCGGDGQMQCEPKVCSPEPMLRKMIAAAATRRR